MSFSEVALVVLCAAEVSRIEGKNVLRDPGFELGGARWETRDHASSFVSRPTRSGTRALKLVNDFTGDRTQRSHNVVQGTVTGIEPGREYEYSVWVSGENVAGIGIGGKPMAVLSWRDRGYKVIRREHYMWAPYGTYGYHAMAMVTEAPAGTVFAEVGFRSWWDCTGGSTTWDDVVLMVKPQPRRGALAGGYQAEGAGSIAEGRVESTEAGYTGTGYVIFKGAAGHVEWTGVSAGTGGAKVVGVRFAWESVTGKLDLLVNGVSAGSQPPPPTGSPSGWATLTWPVTTRAGGNDIRLMVTRPGFGVAIDRLDVYAP